MLLYIELHHVPYDYDTLIIKSKKIYRVARYFSKFLLINMWFLMTSVK